MTRHSYGTPSGKTYIIPATWLALWNSMIQVGAMFGALMNGAIADRVGRKISFSIGCLVAIAGRPPTIFRLLAYHEPATGLYFIHGDK